MTAGSALTVIAISVAVIALIQVAGIVVLWRVAAQLSVQAKLLQDRAEALERLVAQTAERVSATADDIGRTARSLGQAAGAFGRIMQGAGVGAWILRRLTAGAAPVAAASAEAAAGAARLALVKAGMELAGHLVRAIGARQATGAAQAAAAAGAAAAGTFPHPRHRRPPAKSASEAPADPTQNS